MELKDLPMAAIAVSILVTAFVYLNIGFLGYYGVDANTENYLFAGQGQNMSDLYQEFQGNAITNSTVSESNPIGFFLFSNQMWAGLKLMVKSPGLAMMMMQGTFDALEITWVLPYLALLLGMMVTFMLLWMFWRYRQ